MTGRGISIHLDFDLICEMWDVGMHELGCSSDGDKLSERISLCMIVRNEGDFLRTCLESVRDVVDEMIIVDTGSTDDSMEICRSFGAKIYHHTWNDDFANARNCALSYATGDWILWLDADEVLDSSASSIIREAIQMNDADYFTFRMINYYSQTPSLDKAFQISLLRLFRNREGLQFINNIHERLDVKDIEYIRNLPVCVHHYGYMPHVMKAKDKHTRNLQLLSMELLKPDYSPWVHYHIAGEYYNLEQYDVALKHLDVGILKFILSGLKPPSMCYRLKYVIFLHLEQAERALSTIDKAIAIYPDYVDLHFMKGLFLMEQQMYEKAYAVFQDCISIGEDNWEYLTLKGVGSFRAWYYRALCLERMGKYDAARKEYKTYLELYPECQSSEMPFASSGKHQKDFEHVDKNDAE